MGHDERLTGVGLVEDRQSVGGVLVLRVRAGIERTVRTAVTARVERYRAKVPCEVRDLHLPAPRVHDCPRWDEDHRRLLVAVDLVEDADAVPLDVALGVWIASACLLARLCGQ